MTVDYLLGTDGEATSRSDAYAVGDGRHHAVAAAAVDGSDTAVALCGATVRVWLGHTFSTTVTDSAVLHETCADLVAAARHAATLQDDAPG